MRLFFVKKPFTLNNDYKVSGFPYSPLMKSINIAALLFALFLFAVVPLQAQPETGFRIPPDARSEDQALRLSLINTVFPFGLGYGAVALFDHSTVQTTGAAVAAYGLVVGPSIGNLYANDYLRGGLGALARFGGVLLLKDATRELLGDRFATALGVDDREVSLGDTEVIIGSVLMVGGMAFNYITAPVSAREHNREMGYAVRLKRIPGTGRSAPVLTARINF